MKIIIRTLYLTLLLLPFTVINAQQEPHFVHNMYNNMFYNPGFVGSVGGICATGLYRQQWVGFKDDDGNNVAPLTYNINIHSPVTILHGGIGLNVYSDKLGYQREIGFKLMYAYRIDIGMGNLGIGVQLDLMNSYRDWDYIMNHITTEKDDPLLQDKAGEESDMVFDFGLGIQYFIPDKFYVGLSSTRILESTSDKLVYQYKRHYFLTGNYEITFRNNSAYVLEPSLFIGSDLVKTEYDLALRLIYNNKVWGGVSYSNFRVYDPLSVLLGVSIKDIRIGYAYTIPTSAIGSSGSHEVMVGYCFKINLDKGRRSYRNTRFL